MHSPEPNLHGQARPAYRPDIDGLRAIAVLSVVAYHFFPDSLKGGFAGVDVFFVISGFLIGGMLLDDFAASRFSLLDFYVRRVRRIFPALCLVLAASLALGWFVLLPDDFKNLGKHTAGGAGFVSNIVLWSEAGYFDVASERKPLLHLWSLGIEEQFYIFFPVFLWAVWRLRLRPALCIALLALGSFAWNLAVYATNPAFDFYMPMTRFWELLAGVLVAAWDRSRNSALADSGLPRLLLSIVGLALLCVAFVVLKEVHFPGWQALLPVAGTVCLIAAGMRAPANRLLSLKPMVWIGLISYPLYLWHWPVLIYLRFITNGAIDSQKYVLLAAIGIVFALAALTYYLVERPLRFDKRGRKRKAAALAALILVLGVVGWRLYASDGFPDRWVVQASTQASGSKQAAMQDVRGELMPVDLAADRQAFTARYGQLLAGKYGYFHNVGGKYTTVVYGDSHGSADYPAIAAYNGKIGVNTLWFTENWRFNPGYPSAYVEGFEQAVFDTIRKDESIRKIFVITYHRASGCRARSCLPSQAELDGLQRPGLKIYLVADNPVLSSSSEDWMSNDEVQKRLARQLAIAHPLQPRFLMAESGKAEFPERNRAQMMQAYQPYLDDLHSRKGVTFVDGTLDAFCDADACPFFDERGLPMYKDSSHLSPTVGAGRLVEKVLKPYLDE